MPALINAIEILPGVPHKMLPVRILAGGGPHYQKAGLLWRPDRYFLGGNSLKHTLEVSTPKIRASAGANAGEISITRYPSRRDRTN